MWELNGNSGKLLLLSLIRQDQIEFTCCSDRAIVYFEENLNGHCFELYKQFIQTLLSERIYSDWSKSLHVIMSTML